MRKKKYTKDSVVDKIFNSMVWQGETPEQLIGSMENPEAADEKRLKSLLHSSSRQKGKGGYKVILRPRQRGASNEFPQVLSELKSLRMGWRHGFLRND